MYLENYKELAKVNTNFRQVLKTGEYAQVVAMSLPVGGDIGEEVHEATDQIFLIADGKGEAVVGGETRPLEKKDLLFVPAGTVHNIKNAGDEDLKLITIYAPPAHADGTVQATKAEAAAAEDKPVENGAPTAAEQQMINIKEAFQKIHRADFVPAWLKDEAGFDAALPIGFGQTISQPTTVRMMLGWLDVQPGDKILDIGSGSGWASALLAYITGPEGKVFAVEKVPQLLEFGRDNCQKAGVTNVQFFQAGQEYGLPKYSPYNRILVSASARKFPEELLDQLKVGGKLVIPVKNDILEITKTSNKDYDIQKHPGFIFVPLI